MQAASEESLRIASVGSDDLYMDKDDRAKQIPEIQTRLDPRSLDPQCAGIVSGLKHLRSGETLKVPRFNKGLDKRDGYVSVEGPLDIIFYEGWRVGVPPGELHGYSFDYTEFNKAIDYLTYLSADPNSVKDWKIGSSKYEHE